MAVFILPGLCVGFLAGLVTGLSVALPGLVVAGLLAGFLSAVILAWRYEIKLLFVVSLFFIGLSFGAMSWVNAQSVSQYSQLYNQEVVIKAKVLSEPETTSGGNQAVYLQPENFSQLVRVSLFNHAYVKQEQTVLATGVLKQPENFSGFNYVKYLQYRGVHAELKRARIYVIDAKQNWHEEQLRELRNRIIRLAEQRLSATGSAIVLGVLVGQRDKLPDGLHESYQRVGLIHILVVSGYNLTILASGVGVMGYVLGRRLADATALTMIWLFVILVGAESSVVRAGIMASVLIISRSMGRVTGSYLLLLYAVTAMAAINPLRLFYDIGLQLSVAATFGVLTANHLRRVLNRTGSWGELIWSSGGAILATAPLIALYFGTLSLMAPVANLLILPMIPALMLFGGLSLLPLMGQWFAVIGELLVSLQINIVRRLAELPFSQINFTLSIEGLLAYYVFILAMLSLFYNYKNTRLKKTAQTDTMTKIII